MEEDNAQQTDVLIILVSEYGITQFTRDIEEEKQSNIPVHQAPVH